MREPTMSAGLYHLARGAEDRQSPHREDEIYYVLSGKASFRAGGEARPVSAGSVLFVPATMPHRFEAIEEDLSLLVVFSTAKPPA